ncbi:hypothetical protein IMSHALPRED_010529 [Imshaugia aleurites]|uniref:Uncharacterized protein n=1 Tax=Imshaugia aleurites TaxID=172621 RepID=A0A8H3ID44_9LECA|nr:hypothetical protein IMSHALPRED_010529 [Imshaugia aleurites]
MAHHVPTLTWSLDSTAIDTISVAKGVIRAATSDNVQPLALNACEKFGATLAMCPETNKKMEDLIIKVSGPKFVRFMTAQIGYSANDCATQLSRSFAGVQFLGLAAALVSSVGMFEGADALSAMLMASASDKTLLPTVRQLKDLLGAMEHRLNRSGFSDTWVGYQILLSEGLGPYYEQSHDHKNMLTELMRYPGADSISKLVEAFRELNRVGDATAITIQAAYCAPWVMAFTRWCLGIPPSTYLPDRQALLDQPESRVKLFISNERNAFILEIAFQRSIGSPADLLKSQALPRSRSGMITVECFGQMKCQEMGGETSDAYKAMSEALPYALKQICELLKLSGGIGPLDETTMNKRARIVSEYPMEIGTQPFPKDATISVILTRVLNSESHKYLQHLNEGCLISDLPLVRLHLDRLAKICTCKGCRRHSGMPDWSSYCKKSRFLSTIPLCAADILALSLFEDPETLLVLCEYGDREYGTNSFTSAIDVIINQGKPVVCGAEDILAWGLAMVGHTTEDVKNKNWVTSCFRGQAVYPKVFESRGICQPGYLRLSWAPGLLFFEGETYDRAIGLQRLRWQVPMNVTDTVSTEVSRPLNLVPNMKMEWKVVRRDGYLEVYPVCGQYVGHAFKVLANLANGLILRGCPHDSSSPLERPDMLAYYEGLVSSIKGGGRVAVVAVDGDAGLRMFAMSVSTDCFVIRSGACLQCCLDLCRKAGYDRLIC